VGGVLAISPSNESNIQVTYESMQMTGPEVAEFVGAEGSNCGASIMAPEPFNMDSNFINAYLNNATAKAKTGYISGHIYGKAPYSFSPGKEIWMTEYSTNTNNAGNWNDDIGVAKNIHDCMNVGWNMYVWWYIRRAYGLMDENGTITKRGYAMAHFARFVRPGYNKISCTANPTPGVSVTAYKSGSILVVVIINLNSAVTNQPFQISGATVTGFNRYVTTATENLARDSFTVSGGSFNINLQGMSVTTLVSS